MDERTTLESLFAAWGQGDFSTAPALFAPGMRFSAAQPEGQVEAVGAEGVRGFMQRFLPEWDRYRVELHELEDLGEGRYLATATQHGTGAASGTPITAPAHIAIRMREGQMTELHFFFTREEALAALG